LITIAPLALGVAFAVFPTLSAPSTPLPIPTMEWHEQVGDRLVVDTKENEGYLIHRNGRFLKFPVATGQHRFVCYAGRCYNATTPERTWQVRSKDVKGDRITFGPTGRFLRFTWKEEETPYGVHEYAHEDWMFAEGPRYRSMGCVIVKKEIMDILDRTYAVNEGIIDVVTKFGVTDPLSLAAAQ
jgi:hypothetical protein